jgi:hypothetical protein
MKIKSIEVFSEDTNVAIVRAPGRRFPGSVIQGDSLSILVGHAKTIWEKVKDSGDEDLLEASLQLVDLLGSRLDHYARVLTDHGIELPYATER